MRARDIMTKEIIWIQGDSTALEATESMREHGISSLLVDRRSPDDAWGIVTLSDVVKNVVEVGGDPRQARVHEIMTKPLLMIAPGLRVDYCAQLMERTGVRRLPVFDGEKIVGIVTHRDIVRALLYSSQ
jgi:CBS domain-containing protein